MVVDPALDRHLHPRILQSAGVGGGGSGVVQWAAERKPYGTREDKKTGGALNPPLAKETPGGMAVAQERDPPAGAARSANVEGELLIPINSYQLISIYSLW